MNVSTERYARNQRLFREVNERLREAANPSATITEYVCECSGAECDETIELDLSEYDAVRSTPNALVIVPGHEQLTHERVVVEDTNERFMLVEKVVLVDKADIGDLQPRRRQGEPPHDQLGQASP